MLPVNCVFMLKSAALSKDVDKINRAIDAVKAMAPESFLQDEQDFKKRVFHHRPFGIHWSGDYRQERIL
jgi:hypothetical protein